MGFVGHLEPMENAESKLSKCPSYVCNQSSIKEHSGLVLKDVAKEKGRAILEEAEH